MRALAVRMKPTDASTAQELKALLLLPRVAHLLSRAGLRCHHNPPKYCLFESARVRPCANLEARVCYKNMRNRE